jgi:hypothetical protein
MEACGMSVQAVTWALQTAPCGNQYFARLLLVTLADYAHPDGTAAFPSVPSLVAQLDCSESGVRKTLKILEEQGLIRRGDQNLVSNYRAGHRPVVWDLCLEVTENPVLEKQRKEHEEKLESKKKNPRPVKFTGHDESLESRGSDVRPVNSTGHDSGACDLDGEDLRPVPASGLDLYPSTPKPITKPNNINPTPSPSSRDLPQGETLSENSDFSASGIALRLSASADRVGIQMKAPSRRELESLELLMARFGADSVTEVLDWALTDSWWFPTIKAGVGRICRNFETLLLQFNASKTKNRTPAKKKPFVVTEAWIDACAANLEPYDRLAFRRRLLKAIADHEYGHPRIAARMILADFLEREKEKLDQHAKTPEPSSTHFFKPSREEVGV